MRIRVAFPILFLLLAGYGVAQSTAQKPAVASSKEPVFETGTQTVLVDVTVTGKKGEPVTGLTRKDFEVLENGQPQQVAYFEEHPADYDGAPKPQSAQKPASPQPLPPGVFTNKSSGPTPDAVNVLLIDTLNTPLEDQTLLRKQVIQELGRLPRGTRMAIFVMSAHLGFIQGFTSDPSLLLAALRSKELNPQFSPLLKSATDDIGDTQTIQQMQKLATVNDPGPVLASVVDMKRFLDERDLSRTGQRIEDTLSNLQQLGRYLAGVPGRKNLIWFSGSFPLNIYPDAANNPGSTGETVAPMGQTATDQSPRYFGQELARTAELLHAAQVAVYPVDAGGLKAPSFYDLQTPESTPGEAESARQSTMLGNEVAQRAASDATLDQIADETGGKAYYNTNGLGTAMLDVVERGKYFYTLAYTPTDKNMNGKFRHIKVRMLDGKDKLFYRRGYYAISKASLLSSEAKVAPDPLREFMAFGMPNFHQITYQLLVQPGQPAAIPAKPKNVKHIKDAGPKTGPLDTYNVYFAIPIEDIQFSTSADGVHHGAVNLSICAYDEGGMPVYQVSKQITMDMPPALYAKYRQVGLQLKEAISIPKEKLWLRTGVYDPASAKVGTLEIPMSAVTTPRT